MGRGLPDDLVRDRQPVRAAAPADLCRCWCGTSMSKLVAAGRPARWISASVAVAAAGAAAGFAAAPYLGARAFKRDDPYADEPLGSLRGRTRTVTTDDGVALHVDVDDAPASATTPTIVF